MGHFAIPGSANSVSLRVLQLMIAAISFLLMMLSKRLKYFHALDYILGVILVEMFWSLALVGVHILFIICGAAPGPAVLIFFGLSDWLAGNLMLAAATSAAAVISDFTVDTRRCSHMRQECRLFLGSIISAYALAICFFTSTVSILWYRFSSSHFQLSAPPVSRPAVHSVDIPPPADAALPVIRMEDYSGMPGTRAAAALRLLQFLLSVASLCVMVMSSGFTKVETFRYFVAAVSISTLWSITVGVHDIYALVVRRHLHHPWIVWTQLIGDGVISTLLVAAGAGSAGIVALAARDFLVCSETHCPAFTASVALAFATALAFWPMLFQKFRSLAS